MPQAARQNRKKKFTYQEYLTWDDDERWEIIQGEAYNMTPAPTSVHQRIGGICYRQLDVQLAKSKCIAFMAPTDVVFSEENVVQPDVFVVCEKKKITATAIHGAPTLILEILSPSTGLKDKREKKALYEKYGVKEYLIIDPEEVYVERYVLKNNAYGSPQIFGKEEILKLKSLKGVQLDLKELFESLRIFSKNSSRS